MPNALPHIVWDVDDILNDFMFHWLESFNQAKSTNFAYSDFKENPPHNLLGITLDEYKASLDEFRQYNFDRLPPSADILDWFKKYGHLARHSALSAVPIKSAHISASWTLRHFGYWIRSFNFVPSPRNDDAHPLYDITKASFLRFLGNSDIFVEDNEINAIKANNEAGVKIVIFPRPWNSCAKKSVHKTLEYLTKLLLENRNRTNEI